MLEEYADILTVDEACEALRVGYNALYALLGSGELKAYRNGRTWRIPKLAVMEYILERSKIKTRERIMVMRPSTSSGKFYPVKSDDKNTTGSCIEPS